MPIETRRQERRRLIEEARAREEALQRSESSLLELLQRSSSQIFSQFLGRGEQHQTESGGSTSSEGTNESEEMAQSNPAADVPRFKAPTFDGKQNVASFIWAYKEYMEMTGLNEATAIRQLAIYLTDEARDIYHQHWGDVRPETLDEALKPLEDAFCPDRRQPDDYSGILTIRQGILEKVEDYNRRFQKERAMIPSQVPDNVLKTCYIGGLLVEISRRVSIGNPITYAAAVSLARTSERNQQTEMVRQKEQDQQARIEKIEKEPKIFIPTPRFQPGGATQRVFAPSGPRPAINFGRPLNRPIFRPMIPGNPPGGAVINEEQEDPTVKELRERLGKIQIGSVQHQQLQEEARQQQRCLVCFSRRHFARNCPQRGYQVNSVRWYTGPSDSDSPTYEERCEAEEERQSEWERTGTDPWATQDPESAQ
jgi:hypothetical protein